jgi:hypothetical protein
VRSWPEASKVRLSRARGRCPTKDDSGVAPGIGAAAAAAPP